MNKVWDLTDASVSGKLGYICQSVLRQRYFHQRVSHISHIATVGFLCAESFLPVSCCEKIFMRGINLQCIGAIGKCALALEYPGRTLRDYKASRIPLASDQYDAHGLGLLLHRSLPPRVGELVPTDSERGSACATYSNVYQSIVFDPCPLLTICISTEYVNKRLCAPCLERIPRTFALLF